MGGGDTSISYTSHRNDHDSEESGKYDIGKQPPRKRRRKGREEDKHTVFIADDDEESGSSSGGESTDAIEAKEYALVGNDEGRSDSKPASSADTEKKRAYWLSKATGLGEDAGDNDISD